MSYPRPSSDPHIYHGSAIERFDSRGYRLPCYCTDCSNLRKAETTSVAAEPIAAQTVVSSAVAPSVPLALVPAVIERPAPVAHTMPIPVVVQTAPGSSYSNSEDTNSAMLRGLAEESERSRVTVWHSRGPSDISVHPSIATMMYIGATQRAVGRLGNIKFVG